MKKLILLCAVAFGFSAIAQNAVVSCGGDAFGTNGSISYTVGQTAYQFVSSSDGILAEGVQVPYEILVLDINERPEITLNAIVFPNPTMNSVELKIETDEGNVIYEALLLDVNGKLLKTIKITDLRTLIEMKTLPEGIYFLKIFNQEQALKTFKIIKS